MVVGLPSREGSPNAEGTVRDATDNHAAGERESAFKGFVESRVPVGLDEAEPLATEQDSPVTSVQREKRGM
jgi:hypothetical protein